MPSGYRIDGSKLGFQPGNNNWKYKKTFRISKKTKEKMRISHLGKTGCLASSWKGGRIKNKRGYILVYSPNHCFCDSNYYVLEHRLIMEKHIKRMLYPKEVVHHINGIYDDNRIENLILYRSHSEHAKTHFPKGCKIGTISN